MCYAREHIRDLGGLLVTKFEIYPEVTRSLQQDNVIISLVFSQGFSDFGV